MEKKADFHSLSARRKCSMSGIITSGRSPPAIAALCFVIYLIYHYATYRDPLLNVIMMNCNDSITADSKGFDEFLEACGYDPKEDSVSLTSSLQFSDGEYSTSYNDTQVLTLMLAAGGQDLFFGTGDEYLDYADQGALMDLSTVLSDELLDRYQDHLIYTTEDGAVASYPSVRSSSPTMPGFTSTTIMIPAISGILYQNQNLDAALQFADFLLNYND